MSKIFYCSAINPHLSEIFSCEILRTQNIKKLYLSQSNKKPIFFVHKAESLLRLIMKCERKVRFDRKIDEEEISSTSPSSSLNFI